MRYSVLSNSYRGPGVGPYSVGLKLSPEDLVVSIQSEDPVFGVSSVESLSCLDATEVSREDDCEIKLNFITAELNLRSNPTLKQP